MANVCDSFCIWSMQACEFNNDQWYRWLFILQLQYSTVFALYFFFGDCIAHTATAQKGVRNSGDISVICSFLA